MRDLSSITPGPPAGVTSPPALRLNSKPHPPRPPLQNTWCPGDPLLPQSPHLLHLPAPPRPATTTPIRKATGTPAGKGANVWAALQGLPGLPTRPRWGTRPLPRLRCPPRPLREPSRGARRARSHEGPRPIRGPRWPGPKPSRMPTPGGGTPESPTLSALPAGTQTSPRLPRGHPAYPGKPDPPSRLWFPENS